MKSSKVHRSRPRLPKQRAAPRKPGYAIFLPPLHIKTQEPPLSDPLDAEAAYKNLLAKQSDSLAATRALLADSMLRNAELTNKFDKSHELHMETLARETRLVTRIQQAMSEGTSELNGVRWVRAEKIAECLA